MRPRQSERGQARIQQIHEMLINAVVGEDPPDGIAEPGMVVSVRYDDTAEIETFFSACAVPSTGTFKLPSGADLSVTMLTAVPYGMHSGGEAPVNATG